MKTSFYIFFIIILVLVFTAPLIFNVNSSIYGFSQEKGDPLGTIWWIWWYSYAWGQGNSSSNVDLLNYPFGVELGDRPISPFLDYPVSFLNYFINNEIITYNLTLLVFMFLSGFCMYWVVSSMTRNRMAGIISAIIFAFSPNQLMHYGQHLGFSMSFLLPLYLMYLYKLLNNINYKNVLICSVLFSLLTLSNYYYGYFMTLLTIIWFFYMVFKNRQKTLNKRTIAIFTTGLAVCLVSILPFILPKIITQGSESFAHRSKDIFMYAARCRDYFMPCQYHPVFGQAEKTRFVFEKSLYVGYTALVLAIVSIVGRFRRKKEDVLVPICGITAILFFLFSLSPIIRIGSIAIPNLSFFAYKILPMFRVYSRMGYVVQLCVAVLAGYGIKYIGEICSPKKFLIFSNICIVLLVFEYIHMPPLHNISFTNTPSVYKWLEKESKDTVVVEYPFFSSIEAGNSEYLFWQTRHKKKIINGGSPGSLGDAFRKQCIRPWHAEGVQLLKYLGADFAIIHKYRYTKEELASISRNPTLIKYKEFPETIVYKIAAKSEDFVIVYWKKIAQWEKWADGRLWRWLGNNAVIWIGRNKEENKVNLLFNIIAFSKKRTLEIYINDIMVKTIKIGVVDNPLRSKRIILDNILLKKGENIVRFYCPEGEDKIGDILGTNDNRRVSFGITQLKIFR